jgi:SAM-dependent methyltransferase
MRRASSSVHHEVWESLGATDPDWAVLTEPGRRGGRWEGDLDEFYATGRAEIQAVLESLPSHASRRVAVDWGSGTGRLTFALAQHFEHVLAVDVSRSMLAELDRRAIRSGLAERIESISIHDAQPAGEADLVVSLLVIQHLPSKAAALAALSSMMVWLREGGHLVVEVPDRALTLKARLQPRYRAYRLARALGAPPEWLHARGFSGISMLTLDAEDVRRALALGGGVVVSRDAGREGDGHAYRRYVARRAAIDLQTAATRAED